MSNALYQVLAKRLFAVLITEMVTLKEYLLYLKTGNYIILTLHRPANVDEEDSLIKLLKGIDMISALSSKTDFLSSNSEARRALKENSISINKYKVKEDYLIQTKDLINDKYVIINKGKRNTFIIKFI